MYDYSIRRIKAQELESTLQGLSENWELVSIVPTGATINAPLIGEYFLVIIRRPQP